MNAPRCVWDAQATLGEGTCWSVREQSLYWVDILGQRLHRYTPASGAQRSWSFDETISAVAERASAPGLAVTLRHGLALFDPESGSLQHLHAAPGEPASNRFNDGKCDARGRFWGGTMDFGASAPTGALYRFDKSGVTKAADVRWPVTNGPTWSLDGRTMFFTETVHRQVFAFDVDVDAGTLGEPRMWLRFDKHDGHPDGMTTDAEGHLWIAHWGGACVTRHDPVTAREVARIALPTSHITNVAFGGPALKTLFITSARSGLSPAQLQAEPLAGALFAMDLDVAGMPAHLFAG